MGRIISRVVSSTLALALALTFVPCDKIFIKSQLDMTAVAIENVDTFKVKIIVTNENAVVKVVDSNGIDVEADSEGEYTLKSGVDYTYTAIKDENSVSGVINADNVSSVEEEIRLTIPETKNWIKTIAFGSAVNKRGEYNLSSEFTPELHDYSINIDEGRTALCVWAEINSEAELPENTVTKIDYVNPSTEKACTVDIENKNGNGTRVNQLLIKNKESKPFTVSASYTENGLTYKQVYNFNVLPVVTLSQLNISSTEGETILSPEFSDTVFDYKLTCSDNVEEIKVSAKAYTSTSVVDINVNGETVATGTKNSVETLIGINDLQDNQFVVSAKNPATDKIQQYKVKVEKQPTVSQKIIISPADSSLAIYSKTGERIFPDEEGKYNLIENSEYSYTATKPEYVAKSESFIASSADIIIGLEKSAENISIKDLPSSWAKFRGDDTNNCVLNLKTPKTADETVLYWATKKGNGWDSGAIGSPIIVDDYLVFCSGQKLYKMNRFNGEILEQTGDMVAASSFNIVPPMYADGKIFVALSGGIIQAFNADTLESLWVFTDKLGGQPNCPLAYKNGYVYTGFWNAETGKYANFVCVSATDEDIEDTNENKIASWTYKQEGGFYWAGAYATDNFVLIGTDDGKSGYLEDTASLLSLDPVSGKLIDKIENLNGDIRSSVAYDQETDRYYFTTKGGSFYSVAVNEDGTFKKDENGVQGYDLKEIELYNYSNDKRNPAMSTSTPVVYNGRAYIGVSGTSQFTQYSGHNITVIDLKDFKIAYSVPTKGYPQTSGLLTNAYEDEDGYVYVYFIDNYTPGQLRIIKDKPGVTSVVDGVTETYMNRGKPATIEGCAPVLFTPEGSQAQYAICSPICDEYGTLYFKNDSAHMMAVGSKINSIEVVTQPNKTVYGEGEKFDPKGMKVVAHMSNGLDRDITDYVVNTDNELEFEDTDVAITYNTQLYGDKLNVVDGNETGIVPLPLETYVEITVLKSDDANLVNNVIDQINSIGEVTLESEQTIVNAREAYNQLEEQLQEYVSNLNCLVDAELKLEELKAFVDNSSADESSEESSELDSSSADESIEKSSETDSSSADESIEKSSETDSSSADESIEESSETDSSLSDESIEASSEIKEAVKSENNNSNSTINSNSLPANTGDKKIAVAGIILLVAFGLIIFAELKIKNKNNKK